MIGYIVFIFASTRVHIILLFLQVCVFLFFDLSENQLIGINFMKRNDKRREDSSICLMCNIKVTRDFRAKEYEKCLQKATKLELNIKMAFESSSCTRVF